MHDDDPILSIAGLTKFYGGLEALGDVTFSAATGAVTSIIGPNGAGKTTLFNCVSGALPSTAGEVRIKGIDVTGWPAHQIAALGLSRTFQNIQLFRSLSAVENVIAARYVRTSSTFLESMLWSRRSGRERRRNLEVAEQALERVGLMGRRNALPKELPFGDQRRLEIARALATEPALIALDEPTAGMVSSEVDGIMSMIRDLTSTGMSVLLIEHNMSLVMGISDSIVVLDFGRKIAQGDPASIRNDPAVIAAYLGSAA